MYEKISSKVINFTPEDEELLNELEAYSSSKGNKYFTKAVKELLLIGLHFHKKGYSVLDKKIIKFQD